MNRKTKQDEIREGIARLCAIDICEYNLQEEMHISLGSEEAHLETADKILSYLHSQGVVIKVERELLWRYETCKCCTRQQRIAWSVFYELWDKVVIDYYKTSVLCLECFLRMADDRGIDVNIVDINLHASIQRDEAGYVAVEPLIKEER